MGMNEKSLEVLKQYDVEVGYISRGRGGIIVNTDKGPLLFLECVYSDGFYERESKISLAVAECGFKNVDVYIRNKAEEIVSEDEDGKRYILKRWFDAKECNVRDIYDLCSAVSTLAKVHNALWQVSGKLKQQEAEAGNTLKSTDRCYREMQLLEVSSRHLKELKTVSNYLKNKKKRSEFEIYAYKNIGSFYAEAAEAVSRLNSSVINERLSEAVKKCELSHGSYSYHNVLFGSFGTAVTNFEKCCNECQITDLYRFIRKILEKYDWDIELAYKLIDEYDKIRTISDADMELLAVMFAFPEKFWKIINYYFNMNKAWIPPKSIEKLKKVIAQNNSRKAFIETLM